jgi:hypothetical protein
MCWDVTTRSLIEIQQQFMERKYRKLLIRWLRKYNTRKIKVTDLVGKLRVT